MAVRFPDPIHPVDPVELEINQLFDRLITCLQERRDTVLATYRDTRAQIAARHTERARKEQELTGLKTETETRLQMNELRHVQTRILAEIEQELRELRITQPETHVVFRGNCGHLEQLIAGVGELVMEERHIVPRYEDMRPIVAVGKGGKAPGELFYPQGVAIDENTNRIYVAESFPPPRVSIFSETGGFIDTFALQDMISPRGIAIHQGNMYVTDVKADAVFHFKIDENIRLVAKLGSRGSGMGQFQCPRGLSVLSNGDVFLADSGNHRIQILDDSLHIQRSITHQTMENPCDIKLTPDEVYVLCYVFPSILVFSHAGEETRSLITRGVGMQIGLAYFFCLDRQQNLLISDCGSSRVKVFSKEGTHLHSIGQPGHELGMLYYPTGIVLTKNLKLIIVSENRNYGLQIFSC